MQIWCLIELPTIDTRLWIGNLFIGVVLELLGLALAAAGPCIAYLRSLFMLMLL